MEPDQVGKGGAALRYSSVKQAIALLCFGLLSCTACVEAPRTQNRSVGSPPPGFDVCDLLSPRELAGLGMDPGLHIAFRHAHDEDRLTCGYDASPLIGGRTVITKVTPAPVTLTLWLDSGAESLEAMGSDGKRRVLPGVGDEAYIDLSDIDPYVKVYVRTGSRILELDFMRQEGDRVDPAAAAALMRTAMSRLPDRIHAPRMLAYGLCAQIDLDLAASAGMNVSTARVTEGPGEDISCVFEGMEVRSVSGPEARWRFEDFQRMEYAVRVQNVGDAASFYAWSGEAATQVEAWIQVKDRYLNLIAWEYGEGAFGISEWGANHHQPPAPMHRFLRSLPHVL